MKAFLPFIVIGICVGIYFLYINPTISDISMLSVKKTEYESVLEKAKELKVKRDAAGNAYNNIPAEDISRLDKVIPNTFDSVLLANDINTMASKYAVVLKDFKTNESITGDAHDITETDQNNNNPYKTITITMRLVGQYEQFLLFLKDVELNLRLIDVGTLSIKPPASQKTGENSNILEYSLEVFTYSLK